MFALKDLISHIDVSITFGLNTDRFRNCVLLCTKKKLTWTAFQITQWMMVRSWWTASGQAWNWINGNSNEHPEWQQQNDHFWLLILHSTIQHNGSHSLIPSPLLNNAAQKLGMWCDGACQEQRSVTQELVIPVFVPKSNHTLFSVLILSINPTWIVCFFALWHNHSLSMPHITQPIGVHSDHCTISTRPHFVAVVDSMGRG